MGDADRVGHLYLAAVGESGGDDVLGDVARRVGSRAVDLRGVLARERAAAVAGHAAVGVDDDLAAGEAGVADGSADHEAPGRVDKQVLVRVELCRVVHVGGQDGLDHALPEVRADLVDLDAVRVLGGDQDLLDADRPAVLVAHGHLRLAVGAEVGDVAVVANLARGGGRAGARARSASASARASRSRRSRTSSPGRPRLRRRARRRHSSSSRTSRASSTP